MGYVNLAIVICTYNRAAMLAEVLECLAEQEAAEAVRWSVLVVDNNCTDDTPSVVERAASTGCVPGLRRVVEPVQGLTTARRRGVLDTDAEWIAFVDDDCILDRRWIAEAGAFLSKVSDCGGMGGRVTLEFEVEPPYYARGYGWAFAKQEQGTEIREVRSLVGAGMVVRREALEESGWLSKPLLEDRIGERLVSGGDIELGLRVRSAGYPLWYNPACHLRHRIPAQRLSRKYLLRVIYGLGIGGTLSDALTWPGDYAEWRRDVLSGLVSRSFKLPHRLARRGLTPTLLDASYAAGCAAALLQVLRMAEPERDALMGRAVAASPQQTPADA